MKLAEISWGNADTNQDDQTIEDLARASEELNEEDANAIRQGLTGDVFDMLPPKECGAPAIHPSARA